LAVVKRIRKNGQILLDKKYAGREVLIEQIADGIWIIKTGKFIPDNEEWIHQPDISADIDSAIEWAEKHPPQETDLNHLEKQLNL
jgi:hypothetical protein